MPVETVKQRAIEALQGLPDDPHSRSGTSNRFVKTPPEIRQRPDTFE
jgi:hypothetical protein